VRRDEEKELVRRICEKIVSTRMEQGISQQRLSELAGISRTGLRHVESLETSPTLYSLLKLAKALGIEFQELLREEKRK
jgi:transcriptional regulator with XRE-family HTH domain